MGISLTYSDLASSVEWQTGLMLEVEIPRDGTAEWVESILGPFRVLSTFSHSHAYSRLWRLESGGDRVWLKMHSQHHKWAGEVHALTEWSSPLIPHVLGWRDGPCAVLLSECPGERADELEFTPQAEARLWSQAGEWLRGFHSRSNDWLGEVQIDGSAGKRVRIDATALVREGFDKRLHQARDWNLISKPLADHAQTRFDEGLNALSGATFHSIHRDFHPRNWLARRDGKLTAVIDFEHARWDLRASDLNRPWDKEFQRNPRLIDAFYEAYGHPDARLMEQIQTLRLYNLVTGTAWAHEVNDEAFCRFNAEALRRWLG